MAHLTSIINVNVDSNVKEEANNLFNSLGLNMSTAINMFLRKSISEGGIPFNLKQDIPKKRLIKAMKESEDILNGKLDVKKYSSVKGLINDLENEI